MLCLMFMLNKKYLMRSKIVFMLSLLVLSTVLTAQTKVIAHRGYWKPEGSAHNSMSSLINAQKLGVYGSELDVHSTADNVLVVFHDNLIQGHEISSSTYAELRDLKIANGESLPTLEAHLLQAKKHKKTKLIIEIKPKKDIELEDRTALAVLELVRKHRLQKRVEYISFSINICKELVKLKAKAPVAFLCMSGVAYTPKELKEWGIGGLDYHHSLLLQHPEWITEAKALGLTTNVWTVNVNDLIQKFIELKVDYITTDVSDKVMEMLRK